MEKFFAVLLVGGVMIFSSCSRNTNVSDSDPDTRIISKDTVEVQYKVEETQVEIDTIKNTETIRVNPNENQSIEGGNQNQELNEEQDTVQIQNQELNEIEVQDTIQIQNQDPNQNQNQNNGQ